MSDTPTSNDVARLAGVAQSTVSYVYTGKGRISESTRQRVLKAAAELNYQPNAGAQALRSRQSRALGLMYPVRRLGDQPGRLWFLTEVVAACRERGYDAIVVTADEGPDGLRRLADTRLCDGLLVMEVKDREPLTAASTELRVPTVFVGVPTQHDTVMCVARDYTRAGALSVQKLHESGLTSVAVLSPTERYLYELNFHSRFVRGARDEAARRGLSITEHATPASLLGLYGAVGDIISSTTPYDAILASPAVNIVSTAEVLHLHGCMPGTDISLAGVSDDHEPIIDPSGVAIAHAVLASTELARQSVARLLELVSDSPEKLLAGDVDLIGPEWVPGSSLINKSLGS